MREILFRGKDKDGNWHEGFIRQIWSKIGEKERFVICPSKTFDNDGWTDIGEIEIIPETAGQMWKKGSHTFFGGDLFYALASLSGIKSKRTMLCHVVDSYDGMDVIVWHDGEWFAYSYIDFTTTNIVGNIHDNPDLLNQ